MEKIKVAMKVQVPVLGALTGIQTYDEITTGKGTEVNEQPAVTYKPIDDSKQKDDGKGG